MKRRLLRAVLCSLLAITLVISPLSCASAASDVMPLLTVTVNGARMRANDAQHTIITSLKAGTKVFYLGKMINAYSYVRTANGVFGFVYNGHLKYYGAVKTEDIYLATKAMKVYKTPTPGSAQAYSAAKSEALIMYANNGTFAYVRNLNGRKGYCLLADLSKAF